MLKKDRFLTVFLFIGVIVLSVFFGSLLGIFASASAETTYSYTVDLIGSTSLETYNDSYLGVSSVKGRYYVNTEEIQEFSMSSGYFDSLIVNTYLLSADYINTYSYIEVYIQNLYFELPVDLSHYTFLLLGNDGVSYSASLVVTSTSYVYHLLYDVPKNVTITNVIISSDEPDTYFDYGKFELWFTVYNNSFDAGYDVGYNAGVFAGITQADNRVNDTSASYRAGRIAGISEAGDYTFDSLFTSALDVPVKVFTGLFDFNFLGVNLSNFFFSLLTIAVIIVVVKLCLGR